MAFSLLKIKTCLALMGLFLVFTISPIKTLADSTAPVTLSRVAFLLTVPFEKQATPRQCGLAAANMVSAYYDQKLSETQEDWLKSISEAGDGIMGSELTTAFRAADYETAVFAGTLDHEKTGLYYHLDRHRPLIVMITSKDKKSSHYDVLTGYDPKKGLLVILDPASGPITISEGDFSPAWKRANNFTLLTIPKKIAEQPTPAP